MGTHRPATDVGMHFRHQVKASGSDEQGEKVPPEGILNWFASSLNLVNQNKHVGVGYAFTLVLMHFPVFHVPCVSSNSDYSCGTNFTKKREMQCTSSNPG